jgi:hypothetical protein
VAKGLADKVHLTKQAKYCYEGETSEEVIVPVVEPLKAVPQAGSKANGGKKVQSKTKGKVAFRRGKTLKEQQLEEERNAKIVISGTLQQQDDQVIDHDFDITSTNLDVRLCKDMDL